MSVKIGLRDDVLGVQYLRFLAAFCVVYFHTGLIAAGFAWPSWGWRDFGASGVDLFFVISGFVMMIVTAERSPKRGAFLIRRLERIAPFYWGVTLLAVLAAAIYPQAMADSNLNLSHILLSLAFVPHEDPIHGGISSFYHVGWTLNYEMYFYVVFALLLAWKSPGRRLVGLVVWAAATSMFFLAVDPETAFVRVYTNPMLLEFVAGAALGWAYWRGFFARLSIGAAAALLIGGTAVLLAFRVGSEERVVLQGIAATATLAGVLGFEQQGFVRRFRLGLLLGDSTYAIYLVHPMVMTAFRAGARVLHLPVERLWLGAPLVVAMTLASVAVGVIIHLWIERPTLNWLHRKRLAAQHQPAFDEFARFDAFVGQDVKIEHMTTGNSRLVEAPGWNVRQKAG